MYFFNGYSRELKISLRAVTGLLPSQFRHQESDPDPHHEIQNNISYRIFGNPSPAMNLWTMYYTGIPQELHTFQTMYPAGIVVFVHT